MDNVVNSIDVFHILTEKEQEVLNMDYSDTRQALLELVLEVIRKVSELPNVPEEPLTRCAVAKRLSQREIEEISKFATPKTYNATCSACNEWIRTKDIYCRNCGAKLFVGKDTTNKIVEKEPNWIQRPLPYETCRVLMHWNDENIPDVEGVYNDEDMCFYSKGIKKYPHSYIILPNEGEDGE